MFKISVKEGQNIWITSDTHYHHKNIVRGVTNWRLPDGKIPFNQTRDFQTIDEMDARIVNSINACVKLDDVLIHLGDWSFGGFEQIKEFRNRIICKNIYLVTGNHDHHIEDNKDDIIDIFTQVEVELTRAEISYEKDKIKLVLSHYPLCSWRDMSKGVPNLFGHVHLPANKRLMAGKAMDVGMDGNVLTPWNLLTVKKIMNTQPIACSILPSDHHVEDFKITENDSNKGT